MKVAGKVILALALILPLLFAGSSARAATDEEIEVAIQDGLAWLASEQAPDGCWYGWSAPADTGLAVWKFAERATEAGLDPFDPGYVYHSQVENGLNCIFSMVQESGGLVWLPGFPTYETGIDMMALASTRAPLRTVSVPGSPVDGWTYQQVLGGMLDWMEDAQNDADCETGGWGYDANQVGWSDQSNTGYATLGIGFAVSPINGFGLTVDFDVLAKLNTFIDNIQHPVSGGSGYALAGTPPCGSDPGNTLRTGNLVYEMALLGRPLADPTVQAAIGFIDARWNDIDACVGGGGWLDYYQATFTMTKGLQAYGVDLLPVNGDWFDQTSTYIVTHQNPDGSWGPACGFGAGDPYLETSWALLSLEPFVFEPPPPPAPTSIEVSKTADFDGRFVSGTISITNVGENPALISAMADSLEVHFPRKYKTPPPLPEGSTPNWLKVADVPVAKPGVIPVGETVYIDYSFDLCDAADFSGANAMRNVVAVTLANKPEKARTDTVVTRSESFKPTEPECPPPGPVADSKVVAAGSSVDDGVFVVPVSANVVIEIVSVEHNNGPNDAESEITFLADIPVGCEGQWLNETHTMRSYDPAFPLDQDEGLPPTPFKDPGDGILGTAESIVVLPIPEPVCVPIEVVEPFELHCWEPGLFFFTFCNKQEVLPPAIDPDLSNNFQCFELPVEAVGPPERVADIKVLSFWPDVPSPAEYIVSETYIGEVFETKHNNGPEPVTADVWWWVQPGPAPQPWINFRWVAQPGDICSLDGITPVPCGEGDVPGVPSLQGDNCQDGLDNDGDTLVDGADPDCQTDIGVLHFQVDLPVSVDVEVVRGAKVHCKEPGPFWGELINEEWPVPPAVDPDPSNNRASFEYWGECVPGPVPPGAVLSVDTEPLIPGVQSCRSVFIGEPFDVDVVVEDVTDLAGFEFELLSGPLPVEVVGRDVNLFLATLPGSFIIDLSDLLPDFDGLHLVAVADLGPAGSAESGSGTLVRLTMVAMLPPPGLPIPLQVAGELLVDPFGIPIPVAGVNDGLVVVDGPCP